MDAKIKELKEMINHSNNIVFFGGAGVSTESGIPDFRGANGLYNGNHKISPEEILSASFFRKNPEMFFDFYRNNMLYLDAKPNAAHVALAKLEEQGKLSAVITQNIDGLHQAAGSKNVLELHGSVHRNKCISCYKEYSVEYIKDSTGVPRCEKCGGIIKPCVTLYEEPLDDKVFNAASLAAIDADMLIVGGTSLSVYPACNIVKRYVGCRLVIINKNPTRYDTSADLLIADNIAAVLSECV